MNAIEIPPTGKILVLGTYFDLLAALRQPAPYHLAAPQYVTQQQIRL